MTRFAAVILAASVLLGCEQDDGTLPGERFPVRPSPAAVAASDDTRARPISLPAVVANSDWSHRNGTAQGNPPHVAFSSAPQLRWSRDIGEGNGRRTRIVAAPVAAGGLAYAIDSHSRLSAVSGSGEVVWSRVLVPEGQNADAGPGGGMAQFGGVLFVTTGFGEVMALSPANGQTIWRRQLDAPVSSSPAVRDGRVYVIQRDDTGMAFNAGSGETIWELEGFGGGTGLLGGAAPAADSTTVVLPYVGGEVVGVAAASGVRKWGTVISDGRKTLARNRINDISGDPVIDGGAVYTSSQNGRTIRVDKTTGERLWTLSEGAYGPVALAGGSLFLVSDLGTLVRVDAAQGEVIWSVQLEEYFARTNLFGRALEPREAVPHFGPVLAGGKLWVASGNGYLRGFSPADGSLLNELNIPDGAAAPPAVARGVMYIVSREGQLHAFQ